MRTTASLAAFAATAAAQQFVLYAPGDQAASQRADPIITPGELSGHVHDFLGANAFKPELSYDELQNSDCTTVGAADGSGNAADNSVYWHPAMYAKKKNGGGYMKVPTVSHKMYYRKPAAKKYRSPFEFPKGFRMVAGDPFLRAPNNDSSTNSQDITQWICHGPDQEGEDGGFPSEVGRCDSYPGYMGAIHFPHCWNEQEFDQENPNAHMAYPEGNIESGDCPSSHPIALPHIFMENEFDINDIYDEIDTSSIVLAQGDNTGYGWHADFFNGWVEGALPDLFDSCPQGEYGNHDVGTCPSYKKYSTTQQDCKLKNYFKENVEDPGKNLCGCNPISDVNPAPKMSIAKLGSALASCAGSIIDGLGDALGGGYDSDDSSDSTSASATSYPSAPDSSTAAPSTTFATATSYAAPSPTSYGGNWGNWDGGNWGHGKQVDTASTEDEDEDDDVEVVWVTEVVTATAEATAYAKRDANQHRHHLRAHQRRNF